MTTSGIEPATFRLVAQRLESKYNGTQPVQPVSVLYRPINCTCQQIKIP